MPKKRNEPRGEGSDATAVKEGEGNARESMDTSQQTAAAGTGEEVLDIKALLLGEHYITDQDVLHVEQMVKDRDVTFEQAVLSSGILTRELLGQAVAEYFHVPYADLAAKQPPREEALKIPEEVAVSFHAALFSEGEQEVSVATDRPKEPGLTEALEALFVGKKVVLYYALPEDIDSVFRHYRKSLETRFSQILASQEHIAPEILEEIFADALTSRASDIHFEPQEKEVVIRFRIDGVLHEAGRIPKEYYDNILNRVKVESALRIDEHFAAQDGSMRYRHELLQEKQVVDMRVSVVPIVDGEKIAVRLLSEYIRSLALSELGLSARNEEALRRVLKKPFGMVLVTGPTGAGKTTLLYAMLKTIIRPGVNITTIEEPVEYKIAGVNQIQVNAATNLTFAKGLRSIVRQDPNIILVGEIRDQETAEISVNAALTGHLLLSTFHANDASTAIPRLLYMGIEPFLLASTLEVVVAQRLLRRLCMTCRVSETVSPEKLKKDYPEAVSMLPHKPLTLYHGKGCETCQRTGYRGRIAAFELIEVTREMHDLILTNPSAQNIWDLAKKQGATSLFEDGLEKALAGITTVEEVLRVAAPS